MPRRSVTNRTEIPRIAGAKPNDVWVVFTCLKCDKVNLLSIGEHLMSEEEAYNEAAWKCENCGYVHSRQSGLPLTRVDGKETPFASWKEEYTLPGELYIERFWRAFFRIAVSDKANYWKQCGTCGRVQPSSAFDRHVGWGPLEKQLECRSCKAVINTTLNPLRTQQQLHESSSKRRAAELLLEGENQPVNIDELFERFGSKCFKTGVTIKKEDRDTWAIDHILPSRWLYPLSPQNAALLSKKANAAKTDKWPSDFYTNEELIKLAQITGADLSLISKKEPVLNPHIDVNSCVTKLLTVRSATDLSRRIDDIHKLLEDYNLVDKLSESNKKLLGY
jgi:rubredoxin